MSDRPMQKLEYEVTFLTPAFLGNAEQSGQWRTPPFKTLIRQWWRVVHAGSAGFPRGSVDEMRRAEQRLFGTAAGADGKARRSELRLRLDRWDQGNLKAWPDKQQTRISHPEVNSQIDPQLYLGYGPLTYVKDKRATGLKANAAIQAGESARLRLAAPPEHIESLKTALALIDRFGTLGGRSRNGWGSIALKPLDEESALPESAHSGLLRDWREALNEDWPHCIGMDDAGPLVWAMKPVADWEAVMRNLAAVKIALRTQFGFRVEQGDRPRGNRGIEHGSPQRRHWLAYPVTNHPVNDWKNDRLPNSLRFKVRAVADGSRQAVIYHVPCAPPRQFHPDRNELERTWQAVHGLLDELCKPPQSRDFSTSGERLKNSAHALNSVLLDRERGSDR